jgi:hypothetical protein
MIKNIKHCKSNVTKTLDFGIKNPSCAKKGSATPSATDPKNGKKTQKNRNSTTSKTLRTSKPLRTLLKTQEYGTNNS